VQEGSSDVYYDPYDVDINADPDVDGAGLGAHADRPVLTSPVDGLWMGGLKIHTFRL
jgi:hypothetical protein